MSLQRILEDIENERHHQDDLWGVENDDRNTLGDWVSYIRRYLDRATDPKAPIAEQRRRLVQVAALAAAAVESFDRNCGFPSPTVFNIKGTQSGRVSCA